MRRIVVLAAVTVAAALGAPAIASAHDAAAVISCDQVQISYSNFWINWFGTNTVHYRMTIDGATTTEGDFVLTDVLGSAGTVKLPLPPTDGVPRNIALYTAWGPANGTSTPFDDTGGSLVTPLASAEALVCGTTPSTAVPPTPVPGAPTSAPVPVVVAAGTTSTTPVTSASSPATATCSATLSRRYRVRAGQINTVTVTIKAASSAKATGTLVRVTAPGVKRSKRTNSKGVVTFRVSPSKAGTLRVSASGCGKASRVAVLAKKKSASAAKPKFTG